MSETPTPDSFVRATGFAGLGFVAVVLAENVLRAPPPLPQAPFAEVARYYIDRHDSLVFADALFVFAIPCLLVFAIGTARRLAAAHPVAAPWAFVGALSAALMTATFGVVMALDTVMIHLAPRMQEPIGTLLWTIKNAVFLINMVPLATALTAFGIASGIARVGSRAVAVLGVGGGVLGLVATMPLASNLAGSPFFYLGFVSFLCWIAFVVITSIGHLRAR